MGAVWQARRADGRFKGLAAMKLLHLSPVGAAGTRRFEREGAILARLSHPHIDHCCDSRQLGGQQQMQAVAQGVVRRPRRLVLDEPSAGLSPALVERGS